MASPVLASRTRSSTPAFSRVVNHPRGSAPRRFEAFARTLQRPSETESPAEDGLPQTSIEALPELHGLRFSVGRLLFPSLMLLLGVVGLPHLEVVLLNIMPTAALLMKPNAKLLTNLRKSLLPPSTRCPQTFAFLRQCSKNTT